MKEKRLIGISTFFLLLPFLWILPLPCQAASSCPVANTIQPPLDPIENYKDESPFLAPVWFEGESLGCNGGTNVSLCQRNPLPTPGVCIPQDQLVDPFPCTFWKLHLGQDLNSDTPGCRNCDCGHDVFAIANGSVFQIGTDSSWGNYVLLEHEAPSGMIVYSFYAHLQSLEELDGCVSKGAKIGAIGSTGFADTCHLHFEIRRQNPESNPPLGHGYTHHYCSNVLSRYTDPKAFIELYSQNASQEPFHATNPDPPNTATIGKLDECVDDRGTRGSADDVKGPCLQWFKPANADDQDIFLDGFHRGRTWLSCWYLNQTLAPGTHTWEVIPKNAFAVTEHPPLWSFTLNPNACIVPQSTEIASKSTCGSPAVTTNLATGITQGSAALNLFVNPNGFSTQVWFEWGSSSNNLNRSTNRESVGSDDSEIPISIPIDGLSCNTTYSFRAAAENSAGVTRGTIRSFTTASCSSGPGTETRELIFNGDFEDGVLQWATDGDFHVGAEPNPRSGFFYAFLSNSDHFPDNELQGYIQQVVTDVPANAHSVEFSFWYSITTQESAQFSEFDTLDVELLNFGGGSIQTLETLSNLDDTGGAYQSLSFDLTEFAGSSIGIKFIGETDESFPTVFRIDDVSVEAVVPEEGVPPFVVTQEADQITGSSARLNLSVDPNELDTDIWFEWGEGASLNFSTDPIAVGGGNTIFDASDSLFGLDCETTYSFRAFAQNSQGTDQGLTRTLTTGACPGGPPFADTDPADSISADSARLTAEVNPNDTPTEAWFEWGTTTSLGNPTSPQSLPADNQYRGVTQTISSLDCETTYYFQAVAQNTHGTDRGAIHSFATSPCTGPPDAQTNSATSITTSSATLQGQVNPNGLPTEAWFEWGTTSSLGVETAREAVGTGSQSVLLSQGLSGLVCGTTYFYRVSAENDDALAHGATLSFTTGACPPDNNIIFEDSLESGDFSQWSAIHPADGEGLAVGPEAAYDGSLGLELLSLVCTETKSLTLSNELIEGVDSYLACNEVVATNVEVATGADVTFTAGERIVLASGFLVNAGSRFRAVIDNSGRGPRYLEDRSPTDEGLYWAEFAINTDSLTIGPGATLDLLTGYNGDGQPVFRMGLFFDEEQDLIRSRFDLRSQNHSSWVARFGPILDEGFSVFRFLWRSSVSGESTRADLCQFRVNGHSCSFQYHTLVDRVEIVRWGMPRREGVIEGAILLDKFSSGREEP